MFFGACKDGFKARCRPVIGLNGCFPEVGHGRQPLAVVGIDSDNCMFPLVWVVVDVENRANWSWFLEMLVFDIGMHNSRVLKFIFYKQNGLAESVNKFYKGIEHRRCARHSYNNSTLT